MLVRHTRSQIAFLLRQKEAVLTLWVLMLLVLFNFWENCQMFQGKDLLELAHTTKMGLLSWNRASYAADLALLFQQIYPLLVVCPAGFALAKERGTQEHVLMITRMGSGVYYFGNSSPPLWSRRWCLPCPSWWRLCCISSPLPLSPPGI